MMSVHKLDQMEVFWQQCLLLTLLASYSLTSIDLPGLEGKITMLHLLDCFVEAFVACYVQSFRKHEALQLLHNGKASNLFL